MLKRSPISAAPLGFAQFDNDGAQLSHTQSIQVSTEQKRPPYTSFKVFNFIDITRQKRRKTCSRSAGISTQTSKANEQVIYGPGFVVSVHQDHSYWTRFISSTQEPAVTPPQPGAPASLPVSQLGHNPLYI